MATDILRDFALSSNDLSVLASLQAHLIEEDIRSTRDQLRVRYGVDQVKDVGREMTKQIGKVLRRERPEFDADVVKQRAYELQALKSRWRDAWLEFVQRGFDEMDAAPRPVIWSRKDSDFEDGLRALRDSEDRMAASLILLELAVFDAYWPMEQDDRSYVGVELDETVFDQYLAYASTALGFPPGMGTNLRKEVESAQKAIGGYWNKIGIGVVAGLGIGTLTMGLAMPFIAGAVGAAAGLSGAAATSAGLAALGGGAIAAGGAGMAGGMAVIVGGGAVLGLGVGGAAGRVAAEMSAASVLLSSAKVEVVLKEFILQGQHDTAKLQEVLMAQRRMIQKLEVDLDNLRVAGDASDARLKNLERSIDVLTKALKRNQDIVRGSAAES